ncbi:MAG: 2-phosphosulfolactate phosphatase, partial [Gemmatimonadales bacterium]
MNLRVVLTPGELRPDEVAGACVFVIDILRATTTMCAALHHGAKAIIPVTGIDEAREVAARFEGEGAGEGERPMLAGERGADPVPGFDLGNSPGEMTASAVAGRLLVMTTTNGTRALRAVAGAASVHPLAAVNFSAAVQRARSVWQDGGRVVVVCAGIVGQPSREDAYCAGRFGREVVGSAGGAGLSDQARWCLDLVEESGDDWYAALMASTAGRKLSEHGYAEDVRVAGRQDLHPVLPSLRDG